MKITRRPFWISFLSAALTASLVAGCGSKPEPAPPAAGGAKPAAGSADAAKPGDPPKPGAGPAAGGPAKPPMAMPVRAVPVKVGSFTSDVTAVGTLLADESVTLRSEIDGRIVALNFQEGQAVSKGTKLVSIESSEYEAALAASSAELRTKTSDYERAKDLLAKGFVSTELVDRARGAMDVAAARVEQDKARLAKTGIYAPFNGVVGLRLVSPGAYLKAGDNIVRIESISAIKLDFRVPEIYVGRLARGLPVTVAVDAFPGTAFTGRIFAIEPQVDEKSRTVLLRAQVPNTNGKLKPGLFARVSVQLENRAAAIVIPEQAIVPQGKDTFVYRVLDGGKTELTKVEIGGRRPGEVEIVSGLTEKDTVVTEGAMKLGMMPPGAPVTILPMPVPPTAAVPGKPASGEKKGG